MMSEAVEIKAIKERIVARGTVDDDGEAWAIANKIGDLLKIKYGAREVIVFGSLAKKYWTRHSDIDIAFRGISSRLFFKAVVDAESLAGPHEIDLVDLDDCPVPERQEIERGGVQL